MAANNIGIGDIIEARYVGVCDTRPVQLVTRWKISQADAVTDYAGAITNFLNAWSSNAGGTAMHRYLLCMSPDYNLFYATAQRIAENDVYKRSRKFQALINLPGLYATASTRVDNSTSTAIIQRFNLNAGRTEQGDLHIGPLAASQYALDLISAGTVTLLTNLATSLTNVMPWGTTGNSQPTGYRKGTKAAPNVPGHTIWTNFNIGGTVRYMRRRLQRLTLTA